jgi:hypothetical protein
LVWAALAGLAACGGSARPGTASRDRASAGPVEPALDAGVIESVEPWTFNGAPGRIIRTPHYRIFTTQAETVLSARVPAFVEGAMQRYRTALAPPGSPLPEPALKLDSYVLRSRGDWVILVRQRTGDLAEMFLRIPRGGFAFDGTALMFDLGPRDTLAVLGHEGWHQYTQRAFRHPLPIWLEEGIATYMEGHRWGAGGIEFLPWCNVERFDQLRAAHARGALMPLGDLLEAAPQQLLGVQNDAALTYYAQVWALTLFLAEGEGGRHRAGVERLLADAASGRLVASIAAKLETQRAGSIVGQRRGPAVFMAYFDADLARASRAYDAFIETLVRPGSRGAIVEGRSPVSGDTGR